MAHSDKMRSTICLLFALALNADAKTLQRKRYTHNRPVYNSEKTGGAADVGQFPYAAFFEVGPYYCGASVIEPNVAMTAAHCCDGGSVESMGVYAGGINRITLEGFQLIGVTRKIIHPIYNPNTFENDVCLLELKSDYDFSDGSVGAIDLAPPNTNSDHYVGQVGTMVGWGFTSTSGSVSDTLHYAEVTIWSDEQCNNSLYGVGGDSITSDMLCASYGDADQHIDFCPGDPGGALALGPGDMYWEDREQVGIISWGYGCGLKGVPEVYADVAYLRDWIDANNPANKK